VNIYYLIAIRLEAFKRVPSGWFWNTIYRHMYEYATQVVKTTSDYR